METRFVIPAGADPDAVAWPGYRPETWRDLAQGCLIENYGSAWCIANYIDGLGFVNPAPPPPPPAPDLGGNP